MSQPLARLFDKWLDAGGDLTFSEWLTEKRERAQAMTLAQVAAPRVTAGRSPFQ